MNKSCFNFEKKKSEEYFRFQLPFVQTAHDQMIPGLEEIGAYSLNNGYFTALLFIFKKRDGVWCVCVGGNKVKAFACLYFIRRLRQQPSLQHHQDPLQ